MPVSLAGVVGGALHGVTTVTEEEYDDEGNAIFHVTFMTGDYDRCVCV